MSKGHLQALLGSMIVAGATIACTLAVRWHAAAFGATPLGPATWGNPRHRRFGVAGTQPRASGGRRDGGSKDDISRRGHR